MNALRTRPPAARREGRAGLRPDLLAAAAAAALVLAAWYVGSWLRTVGVDTFAFVPPLFAYPVPRVGPGTLPAIIVAALVVLRGPELSARLAWRRLLGVAFLAALAWTLALATVDGWYWGVAARLAAPTEYLAEVPGVTDVGATIAGFTGRILAGQPDSWNTHVGAHPPGALLAFVGLDRIGLGGGAAAGLVCIAVGSSAAVAVAMTLRALGAESLARAALPFGVLFPGAIWVGVSADALFAGALAWGVALLALATARRDRAGDALALAAGLVLGAALHLSYGVTLGGLLVVTVLAVSGRWWAVVPAAAGVLVVFTAFTAAGFWWLDGLVLTRELYYQPGSLGTERPYAYWVWAGPAALLVALGPASAAGLRRAAVSTRATVRGEHGPLPLLALTGAALAAVVVADLSGLSKGEVERIWLPFAVWLVAAAALLPARWARGWLAAQAVLALAVNHLLGPPW